MNPLCASESKRAFVFVAFFFFSFNVGLEQKLNLAMGYEEKELDRQSFSFFGWDSDFCKSLYRFITEIFTKYLFTYTHVLIRSPFLFPLLILHTSWAPEPWNGLYDGADVLRTQHCLIILPIETDAKLLRCYQMLAKKGRFKSSCWAWTKLQIKILKCPDLLRSWGIEWHYLPHRFSSAHRWFG